MTISRCVRIAVTVAALAFAGRLAAGEPIDFSGLKPVANAEPALPSDLALIPGDAAGFISVHPAALFDKVVNKDARKIVDLTKPFELMTGLGRSDIERLTVAQVGDDKQVGVVRTVKPYDKAALLETFVPGAKKQEIEGKVCYKSEDKHRFVYFADERIFLFGECDEAAFARYLKAASAKPDFSSFLTRALSETPQHLAVGCLDMKSIGTLTSENGPLCKQSILALVGDAEWAVVKCDYDGDLKVDVRFTYPTEEGAWQGTKMVRLGVDGLRMLCLQLAVASDLVQGDEAKDLRRFKSALPLGRQLEKSLQGVEAKPVKCDDGYELAVKFGFKASKEALTKALGDAFDEKSFSSGDTVRASSLPNSTYGGNPPPVVAPNPLAGDMMAVPPALPSPPATEAEVVPAPKNVVDSTAANFRAVPKNAAAFLTIRVADLFDKMCDKDLDAFQKFDDDFQKATSLHHEDVELLTVVVLPSGKADMSGPSVCIVTLRNPCDKDKLFAPLQKTPLNKIKIDGKVCYQNDAENRLFYFIDENSFLWGGSDPVAFAACLKALADEPADAKTPLSLALARSRDSHVFGWCDVSKFDLTKQGGELPFLKKLAVTQTATLSMHYEGALKTNVSLLFPDEESAKVGAKALMLGVKMARSQVGMMTTMAEFAKEGGAEVGSEMKEFVGLLDFIEKLEPALQAAEANTAAAADGCWSASIACNVKVGRKAMTKAMTSVPNLENEMFQLKTPDKSVALVVPNVLVPPISDDIRPSSWSPASGELPPPPSATVPPALEKSPVKLTVANTTKVKALLYQQGDDNKLTFCKEVPIGESIDVPAKTGQRWIVLFPDKKDGGETFVLGSSDGTWLLR